MALGPGQGPPGYRTQGQGLGPRPRAWVPWIPDPGQRLSAWAMGPGEPRPWAPGPGYQKKSQIVLRRKQKSSWRPVCPNRSVSASHYDRTGSRLTQHLKPHAKERVPQKKLEIIEKIRFYRISGSIFPMEWLYVSCEYGPEEATMGFLLTCISRCWARWF